MLEWDRRFPAGWLRFADLLSHRYLGGLGLLLASPGRLGLFRRSGFRTVRSASITGGPDHRGLSTNSPKSLISRTMDARWPEHWVRFVENGQADSRVSVVFSQSGLGWVFDVYAVLRIAAVSRWLGCTSFPREPPRSQKSR